jgi:hypothetical protein
MILKIRHWQSCLLFLYTLVKYEDWNVLIPVRLIF